MIRPLLIIVLIAALLSGCGEKPETGSSAAPEPLRLMLDYTPNADHAGIYAARASGAYERAGLAVQITPPPDPSAPLKLLAAGKTDLAISYQPELMLARDQGADLVAVGALVQKPLTALMAIGKTELTSVKDLRGKLVGTTGLPYQSAYLKSIVRAAGLPSDSVSEVNVGFNLGSSLVSGKVDVTLGSFWNYEAIDLERRGKKPKVLRIDDVGVPSYNELVIVAKRSSLNERFSARLRRFIQTTARGHQLLESDSKTVLDGLLAADSGLDRGLQQAAVKATLPVFFPEDTTRPFGYQDPEEWDAFSDWMFGEKLIKNPPNVTKAFTNEYLAGEGLEEKGGIDQAN